MRKKILIVEDEPLIAMSLEDTVRDLGFLPHPVPSLDGALLALENEVIEGAILDLTIRGTDSNPVALSLQEKGIPFIVCTGSDFEKTVEAFRGVVVVPKPYEEDDLKRAIQAMLSGGQAAT